MTTWGEVADFKHFLPRWLEIILRDQHDGFALEFKQIGNKLAYGQWRSWPGSEQAVVEEVLLLCWRLLLLQCRPLIWHSAADFLCTMSGCWETPAPFLRLWEELEGAAALHRLAEFLLEEGPTFLEQPREEWQRGAWPTLRTWVLSPLTYRRLQVAYERWRHESLAEELRAALELLRPLH